MSDQERYQIAKAYVDKQVANMRKNGLKVRKVSAREYSKIVSRLAKDVSSTGAKSKSATNSLGR
jgi:hypothetical protein